MELNLDEYDREYDTDEISLTSSVPANQENDAEYEVEGIISEGQNPDTGETVYLIKWAGYPIHEYVFFFSFLNMWIRICT